MNAAPDSFLSPQAGHLLVQMSEEEYRRFQQHLTHQQKSRATGARASILSAFSAPSQMTLPAFMQSAAQRKATAKGSDEPITIVSSPSPDAQEERKLPGTKKPKSKSSSESRNTASRSTPRKSSSAVNGPGIWRCPNCGGFSTSNTHNQKKFSMNCSEARRNLFSPIPQ